MHRKLQDVSVDATLLARSWGRMWVRTKIRVHFRASQYLQHLSTTRQDWKKICSWPSWSCRPWEDHRSLKLTRRTTHQWNIPISFDYTESNHPKWHFCEVDEGKLFLDPETLQQNWPWWTARVLLWWRWRLWNFLLSPESRCIGLQSSLQQGQHIYFPGSTG